MGLGELIDSLKDSKQEILSHKKIKEIDSRSEIIKRIENRRLPLLYYKLNMDANPHSLNFGYLWEEGRKIYNERKGHYFLEDMN